MHAMYIDSEYVRQWLEVWQLDLVGRARGPAEMLRNFLGEKNRGKHCNSSEAERCWDRTRNLQLHSRERSLLAIRCRCQYSKSQPYIDITTNTLYYTQRLWSPGHQPYRYPKPRPPDPTINQLSAMQLTHETNP